jgi:hypothetical protein
MSNDLRHDVTYASTELQRRLKAKEIPDRQLVRFAFLALGQIALEEGSTEARPLAAELKAAAELHEEHWTEAVNSEMTLAVAEHVGGVDPRFLDMPSYDFAYTVTARERLEARLQAMEVLGYPVSEDLLNQISRADERLAPYLAKRASEEAEE